MKQIISYEVKRNGCTVWLSQGIEPLETDEILEERIMTVADDGKVLQDKDGNQYDCIWNKDNIELEEVDKPQEIEEDENDGLHSNEPAEL